MKKDGVIIRPTNVNIKTIELLKTCYIEYFENGGLFLPIKISEKMKPGASMILMLTLPDNEERISCFGKIDWLTPANSCSPEGIGIGFEKNEANEILKKRIENLLST